MSEMKRYAFNPLVAHMRKLREARGWSLNELENHGKRKGIVYGAWERGDRACAVNEFIEWAALFNLEVKLVPRDNGLPVVRTYREIVSELRRLTSDLDAMTDDDQLLADDTFGEA